MHLLPHGYASVDTASLVLPELEGIATGEEFLAKLPSFDAHFDKLRADAFKEGMVLRYVGVIDVPQKRVKASLEKYVLSPALLAFDIEDDIKVPCHPPVRIISRWFG